MRKVEKMKTNIFYFTYTGNCKLVSEEFQKSFKILTHDVEMLSILNLPSRVDIKRHLAADLILIVFPVWGGQAPHIVKDFLSKLAKVEFSEKKGIVFISTSQKFPCDAPWYEAKRFLKNTHSPWILLYADNIIMPSMQYVEASPIHLKQNLETIGIIIEKSKMRVTSIYENIFQGEIFIYKGRWYLKWFYFIVRRFEAHLFNKTLKIHVKRIEKSQLNAEEVSKLCPRGNMRLVDGKLKIGENCKACLSCTLKDSLFDFEIEEESSENENK